MESYPKRILRYVVTALVGLVIAFILGFALMFTGLFSVTESTTIFQAAESSLRVIVGLVSMPIALWTLVIVVWDAYPPKTPLSAFVRSIIITVVVAFFILLLGFGSANNEWGSAIFGIAILAAAVLVVSIIAAAALVLLWLWPPPRITVNRPSRGASAVDR